VVDNGSSHRGSLPAYELALAQRPPGAATHPRLLAESGMGLPAFGGRAPSSGLSIHHRLLAGSDTRSRGGSRPSPNRPPTALHQFPQPGPARERNSGDNLFHKPEAHPNGVIAGVPPRRRGRPTFWARGQRYRGYPPALRSITSRQRLATARMSRTRRPSETRDDSARRTAGICCWRTLR
jgi:hypothetical protein